ncbi:MAG: hypothetical protein P4L40_08060, partial [Terracidiphilus sp.]|nr:hypothetical protein [Terracidiphilus sp.]
MRFVTGSVREAPPRRDWVWDVTPVAHSAGAGALFALGLAQNTVEYVHTPGSGAWDAAPTVRAVRCAKACIVFSLSLCATRGRLLVAAGAVTNDVSECMRCFDVWMPGVLT